MSFECSPFPNVVIIIIIIIITIIYPWNFTDFPKVVASFTFLPLRFCVALPVLLLSVCGSAVSVPWWRWILYPFGKILFWTDPKTHWTLQKRGVWMCFVAGFFSWISRNHQALEIPGDGHVPNLLVFSRRLPGPWPIFFGNKNFAWNQKRIPWMISLPTSTFKGVPKWFLKGINSPSLRV